MFFVFPEEMQKLLDILEPYFDGATLRKDAPKKKEIHRQLCEISLELGQ